MTIEELAAAGLPAEPAFQNPKIAQPSEGHPSPAASESRSHEDGAVRSDDEDIEDVDADVKVLIRARPMGPLRPSFVFGESKVTTNMIRDYEAVGFFPSGTRVLHWINKLLLPKMEKSLCSAISSPAS
jgi:hypothetical protein